MAEPKSPLGLARAPSHQDEDGEGVPTKASTVSDISPTKPFGGQGIPRGSARLSGILPVLIDGRYRMLGELGAGGMGVVHLAEDVTLGRRVAIKVLSPKFATSPDAGEQLKREARGLAALRNPNVVAVHAFGRHQGDYFFVMEYVDGVDLETILEQRDETDGPIPLSRSLPILSGISHGLAAVHDAGLVHRDVKPSNVLLELQTDRAVLADFGLVDSTRGKGFFGGTPTYCPVEQLLGYPSSPGFDVYAFGVLAYELLTGRLPFGARTIAATFAPEPLAPRVSAVVRGLAPLDDVIGRALESDPTKRYSTMSELDRDLAVAVRALTTPKPERAPKDIERVLVVEPPGPFREILRRAIDAAFFWKPVETAFVGERSSALAKARAWRADLITMAGAVDDGATVLSAADVDALTDNARVFTAPTSATMSELVAAIQKFAERA